MKAFVLRSISAAHQCILPAAIGALLICATNAQAAEPVADTMHKLARDVQVLLPLIYQYEKPATSTDTALINQQISQMLDHLDQISLTVAPKADTYQISYEALSMQLKQSQQEFARGHEEFGLSLLRSATSVCASCHTQDDRPATWLAPTGDAMSNSFVAGEFLFMTRQYDRAFYAYETWLRQQQPLKNDNRTRSAFERLLLTSLQMQKSPKLVTDSLTEFTRRNNIDGALKSDLIAWIAGVNALQELTNITEHPRPGTLKVMAKQWLGVGKHETGPILIPETLRPQIVWLRGELYRALINETDRSMIPDWLYLLAVSDRVLEYRIYYSLADMYLKQCMLEYTANPIAQSCYNEYENYIVFSYSGSSGTHIPDDVEAELKMLKEMVFNNKAPN